jgi:hypothetical protein
MAAGEAQLVSFHFAELYELLRKLHTASRS